MTELAWCCWEQWVPEGDGHVGSFHAAEVILGQVAGREIP
jgi:hypothetical protein